MAPGGSAVLSPLFMHSPEAHAAVPLQRSVGPLWKTCTHACSRARAAAPAQEWWLDQGLLRSPESPAGAALQFGRRVQAETAGFAGAGGR